MMKVADLTSFKDSVILQHTESSGDVKSYIQPVMSGTQFHKFILRIKDVAETDRSAVIEVTTSPRLKDKCEPDTSIVRPLKVIGPCGQAIDENTAAVVWDLREDTRIGSPLSDGIIIKSFKVAGPFDDFVSASIVNGDGKLIKGVELYLVY